MTLAAGTHLGPHGILEPSRPRRDLRTSLLLGLMSLLVFNANLRSIGSTDTYPARYLPFGIWRFHTVLLDPILSATQQGNKSTYWIVHGRGGHAISLYPVVIPVIIAPLYLPAVVYLHVRGWEEWRMEHVSRIMEKLSASLIAATAVALFYLLLRRRAEPRIAILLTLAFAFGTTTWVIGSQALWQHGFAELLIVATLFLLTGPCTSRTAIATGFLCGLIACNRPPDSILAIAFGIYGLWWARRLAPLLVASAALPLGLVLAYNLTVVGNVIGAYGLSGDATFFRYNLFAGIAGLLFSPTRGLFVFSPFLLFLLCCLPLTLRDRHTRLLTVVTGIAVVLLLLVYAKADWRQGSGWGPRWLTDVAPILVWMLAPVVTALGRVGRIAFVAACVAAVAIQTVGAFWYTGASDLTILAVASGPNQMTAAWDFRNTLFIAELRHEPPPISIVALLQKGEDGLRRFVRRERSAEGPAPVVLQPTAPDPAGLNSNRGGSGDLAFAAQLAAAVVIARQQVPGYWLTAYTNQTHFQDPQIEMNTFLTSVMIDILSPVAAEAGLGESLQRARHHLAGQIEEGGLVRYHGRPDSPTIGPLGCVITPDADDTALVWRIAPPARAELLPAALKTLARYLTPEGLYRTWLAPQDRFECINPGADPNPPDVAIQMHMLMFLAKADAPASHALCRALGQAIGDERIWVYYRIAPLIPILRQADLQKAGCPVQVPASRIGTSVPGQEDWIAAGQLLERFQGIGGAAPKSSEVVDLLGRLSRNGFSSLRASPPLLYHNDLTASAKRFYWSEEFGCALWLRLYFENLHRHPARTYRGKDAPAARG
jgi:hypothetical protein